MPARTAAWAECTKPCSRLLAPRFAARGGHSDTLLVSGGIMSEDPKRELPDAERSTPSEELQAELEPLPENEQDHWDDSDMQNTHGG